MSDLPTGDRTVMAGHEVRVLRHGSPRRISCQPRICRGEVHRVEASDRVCQSSGSIHNRVVVELEQIQHGPRRMSLMQWTIWRKCALKP